MAEARQCTAKRTDGSPCGARPLTGSDRCFFHAPDRAEDRQQAQRAGGRGAHRRPAVLSDAPDLPLETVQDMKTAGSAVFNEVRRGQLDAKVGNCLFVGPSVLLRIEEQAAVFRELAELRRELEAVKRASGNPAAGAGTHPGGGADAPGCGLASDPGGEGGPLDDLGSVGTAARPLASRPAQEGFSEDLTPLFPTGR